MTAAGGIKNIVLLGLGHTHAHVVKQWAHHPIDGYRLIAVSDYSVATYSGMLPGVLAGDYRPDQMQIDLKKLCQVAGVQLVGKSLESLDRGQQQILFSDGTRLPYAVLSVAVGSRPPQLPGSTEAPVAQQQRLVGIKPMQTLLDRLDVGIESAILHCKSEGRSEVQVDIVGGGLGSLEVAMCLPGWLQKAGLNEGHYHLRVISGSNNPPEGCLNSTRKRIQKVLKQRNVTLLTGVYSCGWSDGRLQLDNGVALRSDLVIYVGAGNASPVTERLGLTLDGRGCIVTDDQLRSIDDPVVWAAGDCGSIRGKDVPKAGVYAVRQGPVVWENLKNVACGKPLATYHPQHDFLKLINAGDGTAIGQWKWFSFQGKWVWKWKDHIDTHFMQMYQSLAEGQAMDGNRPSNRSMDSEPMKTMSPMRCLGCGGKVGSRLLRQTLQQLSDDKAATGFQALKPGAFQDDIGLLPLEAGNSLAVTVDSMACPLPDERLFGQIATLHALSDLWVSGVRPLGATVSVEVPFDDHDSLKRVMSGVVKALNQHHVQLLGGHTLEGPRLAISITAFGESPGTSVPLPKQDLRRGDVIVYTKPIGIGLALAGHMRGQCSEALLQSAVDAMLQPNAFVLPLKERFELHGVTDVTGFGMAGHLHEMVANESLAVLINGDAIQEHGLASIQELTDAGVQSSIVPENRHFLEGADLTGLSTVAEQLLLDPQTSGGVLFGIASEQAADGLRFLQDKGVNAWQVGVVVDRTEGHWLAVESAADKVVERVTDSPDNSGHAANDHALDKSWQEPDLP